MASCSALLGAAALALLLAACGTRPASGAITCDANATALDYLGAGYVLLSRYDAIDFSGGTRPPGYSEAEDLDGVVDLGVGNFVSDAAEAVTQCTVTPSCQAVNYAFVGEPSPHVVLKRGVNNSMINLLNGQGTASAETIGENYYFPNRCTGLFVSVRGLDRASMQCIKSNAQSPTGIKACLKCGFDPAFAKTRDLCARCITALKPVDYANVEERCVRSFDCSKAPVGARKCNKCVAKLRASAHPEWTPFCTTARTCKAIDFLVKNRMDTLFDAEGCPQLLHG